jgi:CRP/FNR family transcriptional regulator, cyclic AMP receptor protein
LTECGSTESVSAKQVVDFRRPFLDCMPSTSRDHLLLNSTTLRYGAGQIAFQPGDDDRADILETGFARIYLSSSDGRQTTIRYVHPGELMGGLLVMGAAFDGSVQILVDSTVVHLDLRVVRSRIASDADLGQAVATDLALRYAHAVRTIALHAFGSVTQRVAFDLLERASRNQLSTGLLATEMSQQELADGIGSARQVVARSLSDLRSRRLVATTHRHISVLDPVRLEAVAVSNLF